MPNDWNIDIAGQQGQPGTQGLAGGTFADAPSDGNVYGRLNATWAQAVNKAGDNMTGPLGSGSYAVNAYWNGTNWIYKTTGVAGLINTTSSVVAIYCAPSGTAGAVCTFTNYLQVDSNGGIFNTGNISSHTISGTAVSSSGDMSCSGNLSGGNSIWTNGNFQANGNGYVAGQFVVYNNEMVHRHEGINYALWDANAFSFRWNVDLAGYASVVVDNSLAYPLQSACDERIKQDVEPSTFDSLALVKRLPLHQFRYMEHSVPAKPTRVEGKKDTLIPVGIVAQRLHEVASYLVHPGDRKEIGTHETDVPMVYWTPDLPVMMGLLIGAIQQLEKRVAMLEERANVY